MDEIDQYPNPEDFNTIHPIQFTPNLPLVLNTLFPLRSIISELPLIVLPYIVLVDLKYSQNLFLVVILMD